MEDANKQADIANCCQNQGQGYRRQQNWAKIICNSNYKIRIFNYNLATVVQREAMDRVGTLSAV